MASQRRLVRILCGCRRCRHDTGSQNGIQKEKTALHGSVPVRFTNSLKNR
jgi:hypothetical protein